jgi:uncharacterized membrane protein YidH (DUF202 family)
MSSDDERFPVMATAESQPERRRLMGVVAILIGLLGFAPGFGVFAAVAAIACGGFARQGDGMSRLLGVIASVMGVAAILVAALPLLLTVF